MMVRILRRTFYFGFITVLFMSCDAENTVLQKEPISVLTHDVDYEFGRYATSGGEYTLYKQAQVSSFGLCWSMQPNPTIEDSISVGTFTTGHSFDCVIGSLEMRSTYYIRAFVTTPQEVYYGNEVTFNTTKGFPGETLVDIDGNRYRTIRLGNQVWMADNLRTKRYRNGDSIPTFSGSAIEQTFALQSGYLFNSFKVDTFGLLYTWYVALDPRNVAPEGWHVATVDDWKALESYIDPFNSYDEKKAAKDLCSKKFWSYCSKNGTVGFNPDQNNSSGFSALPSGLSDLNWRFFYLYYSCYFWTSSIDTKTDLGRCVEIDYNYPDLYYTTAEKLLGFSIRCVKDVTFQ